MRRFAFEAWGGRAAVEWSSLALDARHLYIASQTRQVAYVHAGVVGWQGRAVLFPARSWSGKSRQVHALVKAGASFLSDEYAIIDPQGVVYPFPRPLSLRARYHNDRISAEDLGWRPEAPPLRVGAIVTTRYVEDSLWSPLAISQGEAILEMLDNTVSAREAPALVMRCLGEAGKGAVNWKGPRGEAGPTAERILADLTTVFARTVGGAPGATVGDPG